MKMIRLLNIITPVKYISMLFVFIPFYANAIWYDPLVKFAKEFQTGLIIIGGVVAVGSLVYIGICWIISRMSGNMETTAMDYVKHIGVIGAVGGAVAAATWAYSVWGGSVG
ncbi:hypothetical protein ABDM08_004246 [Salmonella enterica]|nr:hypothetical protein [Salmonella enterica]EJQ9383909.1 hypothetical protein [Salmonella enterica]